MRYRYSFYRIASTVGPDDLIVVTRDNGVRQHWAYVYKNGGTTVWHSDDVPNLYEPITVDHLFAGLVTIADV